MAILVSFDIDGTLEAGDPPGPITMDMVRKAEAHGRIIGSSSDRPLPVQQAIWDRHNIQVSFVSPKQGLLDLKSRFTAEEYYHIGDPELVSPICPASGVPFRLDGCGKYRAVG